MTRRKVDEWIGETKDTRVPRRVKMRVFDAYGGVCHISGRKIRPGDKWDLDHIQAIANGGENRESNLAPALRHEHRKKTAVDVAKKKKDDRVRKSHIGIPKAKSALPGGRNDKWKAKIGGGWVLREDDE